MPRGRFHQDQSGKKVGMLLLLEKLDVKTANGSFKYRCKCECGNETVAAYSAIIRGNTSSCGCLAKRRGKDSPNYKHGLSLKTADGYVEYQKDCYLKHKYSITLDDYNQMMSDQNGQCKICSRDISNGGKSVHVDHCHDSGKVRGLLCDKCNRGLGYFDENSEWLKKAAKYLEKH